MRKLKIITLLLVLLFVSASPGVVSAQTYLFTVSDYEVEAYIQEDGSLTLYYYMVFQNDPSADPIDYIDLGLPISSYDFKNVEGTIDGQAIPKIGSSAYVQGAELALGDLAIQPGQTGTIIVWARNLQNVLFPYDQTDRENYVNFQFTPSSFGTQYDQSTNTKYRMTIILPPGVGETQGVYYTPSGWPGEDTPEASTTTDGRVYYSWYTENADVHSTYSFGTAFPASTVPAGSISSLEAYQEQEQTPTGSSGWLNGISSSLPCCLGIIALVGLAVYAIIRNSKDSAKRKMQYMPPKISIEGQGIKRGLTAVEAGILMEEPLDKILTMILFGLLKKEAVTVLEREPLKIQASDPLPEDLHEYEKGFLKAFDQEDVRARKRELQSTMINLVNSVTVKMKSFSKAESVAYYKDIVKRAWDAVEKAQTPEIKSAQYDHTLEWTMLDKEFNEKTERTFTGGPVIIPMWWPRYDPTYHPVTGTGGGLAAPVSAGSGTGAGGGSGQPSLSLPHIPGSDFAASMVNGASAMAAGVIGDVTGFTGAITNKTNPIPVSAPSSGGGGFRGGGGGGHSCACACACAGCACACAGGGR
ncbi:MAG: hypothetical protein WA110_06280 [Anaerolineaceae bacterium]